MTSSPRTNVLAYPAFASLKRGPSANNPALVAVRLHFAVRNRAGRSLPPPGATCSLPHFRFAQMWPRARTPALVAIRLHFAARNRAYGYRPHRGRRFRRPRHGCAAPGPQRQKPGARRLTPPFRLRRNRACGHRPHLLGLPRKIRRGISLRETTLCGCPLRGHGFATPHQYFAVPVTAAPRRVPNGKNPALAPIWSHFAPAAKPGWPVVARPGGNVLATPFSLCSNVAPRSHPGARRLTPPFRLRRNRACGHRPHRGRCVGLPRFRSAQAWPLGQQPGACRHSAPFRCAKPRWPVVAPAGGNVLATPFFASLKLYPLARRSSAYASVSPAAKPRVRSSAPPGPMFRPTPLSLRSSVAPRPTTRRLSPFGSISLRETARAVTAPDRGRYFAVPVTALPRRAPNGKNPHLIPHPLQREQQLVIHVERAPHAQAVYPVLRQPCFAHDLLYRARVHYIRYVFKNHPLTALCCLWERNRGTAAAS